MKVFILEDDMDERMLRLRETLYGHDIDHAESYNEAVVRWDPPYDLVLLDHDLGGNVYVPVSTQNTGSGFCRWLHEQGAPISGRVILHTWNRDGAVMMGSLLHCIVEQAPIWVPYGPSLLKALIP